MFFLVPDSPGPTAHKTVPVPQCAAPVKLPLLPVLAQMPLRHALDTLCATAKAHSLPGHILGTPEQDAFVLWLLGAQSPGSTHGCGLVSASSFSLSVSSVRYFGEVDFVLCPVTGVQSREPARKHRGMQ